MAFDADELRLLQNVTALGVKASRLLQILIDLQENGRSGDVEVDLTPQQIIDMQASYTTMKTRFKTGALAL